MNVKKSKKGIVKIISMFSMLVIIVVMVGGCGGSVKDKLFGNWYVVGGGYKYTFKDDNTFSYDYNVSLPSYGYSAAYSYSGTYSVNGSNLMLNIDTETITRRGYTSEIPEVEKYKIKFADGDLYMTNEQGGISQFSRNQ